MGGEVGRGVLHGLFPFIYHLVEYFIYIEPCVGPHWPTFPGTGKVIIIYYAGYNDLQLYIYINIYIYIIIIKYITFCLLYSIYLGS